MTRRPEKVPPVYIKNTYTDDNPEECCTAGEASPQLYKLIEAVKAEVERYISGERLQPAIPGMEEPGSETQPADMEAREINLLEEEQAADQAEDAANAEKPIKVVRKRKGGK